MASFNTLPNELVLQIVQLVLPGDLESFSSTCKLVHDLAQNSLDEHRGFKSKYRKWSSSGLVTYHSRCLYQLLGDILEIPRIAWYVEALEVREFFTEWVNDTDSDSNSESDFDPRTRFSHKCIMRDEEPAKFRKAIEECVYVSEDELEEWRDVLDKGMDDAILALLMTLLPNLKLLKIRFNPNAATLLFETIRRISTAPPNSYPSMPLSRLTKVELCPSKSTRNFGRFHQFIDSGCLWPFFRLPSMRFVAAMSIRHDEMIPLPERSSDIIQLDWIQPSNLTPEKAKNLLGVFKALQVFRFQPKYTELRTRLGDTEPITIGLLRSIRDSLILYAKFTLTDFSLYVDELDDGDEVFTGVFRTFEVLKKIQINAVLLMGKRGPFRKPLADVLPMSIESVTIQESSTPREEYRGLVMDLLDVKHQLVPNLKRLSLRQSFFRRPIRVSEESNLKKLCKESGFTLKISRTR